MQQRQLGPFQVSAIGLGCMNLSYAYGVPPDEAYGSSVLMAALDAGVTHFDTAALYGFGVNETLVGKTLKTHRHQITLASKGGMAGVPGPEGKPVRVIDGRPEAIRRNCEDSLRRLQTDVIDLYYLHRWDKKVPIEDSVGEMSRLLGAGKVRTLGLSEVSAATLRRAHAVHPITALQTEYSLWTREPEIAVLQVCRELGVAFVAFSPVGRGFLADAVHDVQALVPGDIRRSMPRFAPETHAVNQRLLSDFRALAHEAACTPAQLALAWLLAQGEDILPIPGTSRMDHLMDNLGATALHLSADLITRVGALINEKTVVGSRYSAQSQSEVDTETFPTRTPAQG